MEPWRNTRSWGWLFPNMMLEWGFPSWSGLQRTNCTADEELKQCVIVWISKSFQVHWLLLGKKLFWDGKLGSSDLSLTLRRKLQETQSLCVRQHLILQQMANEDGVLPPRTGWDGGRGGRGVKEQAPSTAQREVTSASAASAEGRFFGTRSVYCPGVSFPYPSSLSSLSSPGQFLMTWHTFQQWQARSLSHQAAVSKGAGRYLMPFSSLFFWQLWSEGAAPVFSLNISPWPSSRCIYRPGGEMGSKVCAGACVDLPLALPLFEVPG